MYLPSFGLVRVIERDDMLDVREDWSKVRSPGRARRRLRRGHRQNIVMVGTPKKEAVSIDGGKTLIMHPALADQLRRELKARAWGNLSTWLGRNGMHG